jgi:carbon storage regulator CsrA
MLVLSRRENEKIVFPNLGISVEVLRTKGRVAQLGINAPREVAVLREEVAHKRGPQLDHEATAESTANARQRHELNNQLNTLGLTLQLIQKRLAHGDYDQLEEMLGSTIEKLRSLDSDARSEPANQIESALNSHHHLGSGSRTALLVDDDANERSLLAELLQISGFDVFVVPDGQQALDFLRSGRPLPDFILLDMMMPGMDGAETIAEIRRDPKLMHAPFKVFAVTGTAREETKVELGEGGVDGWFSKPIDTKSLVQEMSTHLQCA